MPGFFRAVKSAFGGDQKDTLPVNRYEGFTGDGRVVLRDRRGTAKAEIPASRRERLRRRRPARDLQADRRQAGRRRQGDGELHRLDLRRGQRDRQRSLEHPAPALPGRRATTTRSSTTTTLLDLLDVPNEHMTGIELKYVMMAHLELTGNAYWLLDGVERRGLAAARHLSARSRPRAREARQELLPVQALALRVHARRQGLPASSRIRSCTSNTPTRTTRSSASASRRPSRRGSTATTTRWSTTASSSSTARSRPLHPDRHERRRQHRPHPQGLRRIVRQGVENAHKTPGAAERREARAHRRHAQGHGLRQAHRRNPRPHPRGASASPRPSSAPRSRHEPRDGGDGGLRVQQAHHQAEDASGRSRTSTSSSSRATATTCTSRSSTRRRRTRPRARPR